MNGNHSCLKNCHSHKSLSDKRGDIGVKGHQGEWVVDKRNEADGHTLSFSQTLDSCYETEFQYNLKRQCDMFLTFWKFKLIIDVNTFDR